MITINLEQARGLLARAVLTQGPGFVYTPERGTVCFYEPLGDDSAPDSDPRSKTGCLVGMALALAGVDAKQLDGGVHAAHHTWFERGTVALSEKASRYLQAAQTVQDGGETWGQAYAAAERFAFGCVVKRSGDMPTIDVDRARGLLARAVLTQGPGFVYNPGGEGFCAYMPLLAGRTRLADDPKTQTGCLIGTALGLAGVAQERLGEGSICLYHAEWRRDGIVDISLSAAGYFYTAQRAQDSGKSWGTAYERAEETVA
jgi:hypothetical protein